VLNPSASKKIKKLVKSCFRLPAADNFGCFIYCGTNFNSFSKGGQAIPILRSQEFLSKIGIN
jgi:hypothetical protein